MTNKGYQFLTNCVSSDDGAAIRDMVENATDISRRTFLKYVDTVELQQVEYGLGYEVRYPRRGLTMARDWHVSYHRSTYKGQPCVYFCWSAIEHIFTPA